MSGAERRSWNRATVSQDWTWMQCKRRLNAGNVTHSIDLFNTVHTNPPHRQNKTLCHIDQVRVYNETELFQLVGSISSVVHNLHPLNNCTLPGTSGACPHGMAPRHITLLVSGGGKLRNEICTAPNTKTLYSFLIRFRSSSICLSMAILLRAAFFSVDICAPIARRKKMKGKNHDDTSAQSMVVPAVCGVVQGHVN